MVETTKPYKRRVKRPPKMKAMMDALLLTMGNITAACDKVKINRTTHYAWLEQYDDYAAFMDSFQDRQFDFVEGALYKNIQGGNVTAQIFWLKTKGKHKGYVETQEISLTSGLNPDDVLKMVKDANNTTD